MTTGTRLRAGLAITAAALVMAGTPATAPAAYPADAARPPTSVLYAETYGAFCGAEATDAYAQAIHQRLTVWEAIVVGDRTGRACVRRLAHAVRESLGTPRLDLTGPRLTPRLREGP